jgi:hypothetical protein
MKIALTDVLSGGRPGETMVHLKHPYLVGLMLCDQHEDGRVAHHGTDLDVDCMTCLVRASRPTLEDVMSAAMRLPKDFLYGKEDDHADEH